MNIDEKEFREFIAMVDEFINKPEIDNIRDVRPAVLAMKIATKLKGYTILLNNIDHNSSEKFTQLKINYDNTSKQEL